MKYFTLLLLSLSLTDCKCPPMLADGTKPPCKYVGPTVGLIGGINGVTVGVTLYGEMPTFPTTPTTPSLP